MTLYGKTSDIRDQQTEQRPDLSLVEGQKTINCTLHNILLQLTDLTNEIKQIKVLLENKSNIIIYREKTAS